MIRRMTVQEAVTYIKEKDGISNYRLAKMLGVQPVMITRYFRGEVKSVQARIAIAFYDNYNILIDNFNTLKELEAFR